MKFYQLTIKPSGAFGTGLRGDTLFGHFCWQAANDQALLDGGLDKNIAAYPERPFVVFSSAFPKFVKGHTTYFVLKKPDIPLSYFVSSHENGCIEKYNQFKEIKKKKWMMVREDRLNLALTEIQLMDQEELHLEVMKESTGEIKKATRHHIPKGFQHSLDQPHNTINRLTQTTGTAPFTPYTQKITYYYPQTELVVFVLVEEDVTDIDRVCKAMERIGIYGYGKDASIGIGRFSLGEKEEIKFPATNEANACYTLAPAVPQKNSFKQSYFRPFVRFGKHGDKLAGGGNPFKNPIVMADEGAVFFPSYERLFEKPYLGRAVMNLSKAMPETVAQGYAPYLPINLED